MERSIRNPSASSFTTPPPPAAAAGREMSRERLKLPIRPKTAGPLRLSPSLLDEEFQMIHQRQQQPRPLTTSGATIRSFGSRAVPEKWSKSIRNTSDDEDVDLLFTQRNYNKKQEEEHLPKHRFRARPRPVSAGGNQPGPVKVSTIPLPAMGTLSRQRFEEQSELRNNGAASQLLLQHQQPSSVFSEDFAPEAVEKILRPPSTLGKYPEHVATKRGLAPPPTVVEHRKSAKAVALQLQMELLGLDLSKDQRRFLRCGPVSWVGRSSFA